jgi:hypothetical protein
MNSNRAIMDFVQSQARNATAAEDLIFGFDVGGSSSIKKHYPKGIDSIPLRLHLLTVKPSSERTAHKEASRDDMAVMARCMAKAK